MATTQLDERIDAWQVKALKLADDVNSMVLKFHENVTDLKSLLEQFSKGKMRDVEKQQWASNKQHVEVSYNLLYGPTVKKQQQQQQQLAKGEEPADAGVEPEEQFVVKFDNQLDGKESSVGRKYDPGSDELKQVIRGVGLERVFCSEITLTDIITIGFEIHSQSTLAKGSSCLCGCLCL